MHIRTRTRYAHPLRLSGTVAVLFMALFVLTGCIQYSVEAQISNRLEVSGTVVVSVDSDVYKTLGGYSGSATGSDSDFQTLADEFSAMGHPGITSATFDDGTNTGLEVHFDKVPAEQMQGEAFDEIGFQDFSLTKNADGNIELNLGKPMSAFDSASSTGGSMLTSSAIDSAIVSITMPGEILEAEGATITDQTATWDLAGDLQTDVHVISKSGTPWWLWIVIVVAVLVLLIVVAIVVLIFVAKKKSAHSPTGPTQAYMDNSTMVYHAGASAAYPGSPQATYPGVQSTLQYTTNYEPQAHPGWEQQAAGYPSQEQAPQPGQLPQPGQYSPQQPQQGNQQQPDTDQRFRPPSSS